MALVRKNIQMSKEIAEYYEKKSVEMGVSQSSLMTIALKDYIDKEKAMSMMGQLNKMINDVKYLQNQNKK